MIKKALYIFLLLSFVVLKAQEIDPLESKNKIDQTKWVDSIIKNMSIEQKIGQLFMVQAYSNKNGLHTASIDSLIVKQQVGGLIFMQGTPEKQVELTNRYQKESRIPLLIGFDGEWGLDMRLDKTYRFPWNMTLGAITDGKLIEEFGAQLGKHCKRIGIHINFAPVVDVNTNPDNPIIGNRSFGESRENVTEKSLSFIRGIQSVNVLSSAKHFPGHGDTSTDSHLTLPVLDFDFNRLDSIELYPYKKLIQNKLTSVMVAHLSVNALEPNSQLPTSLSYNVISNLLKRDLKFNGLILTDALNMKGAANFAAPGDVDLAAFLAGNDILLIPENVPAAIEKIKNAIENKIITIDRLNYSVQKILKAKYWAGLNNYKPIETYNLAADLNSVENELLHRKLIENSITLVKNDAVIFPIQNIDKKEIAYVKFGDDDSTPFVKMLNNYTQVDVVAAENLDELLIKLKDYNLVIIGYHKSNANPWKSYKFLDKELVWIQEIARENKVILDVFTSPYSLLDIQTFQNVEGLIVSYQNSVLAQEISAQMIFGALDIKGKLPVSIKKSFSEGHGLLSNSLNRLAYSIPEAVGMSSFKMMKIDSMANVILKEKMTPGMQILVARKGKIIYNKSFGFHTDKDSVKVENSDLYDVASMTKILASVPLIMELYDKGNIKLETTLGSLLPKLKKTNKNKITVKEVLSHYGQLQAWIPFYTATLNGEKKPSESYYQKEFSKKFNLKVMDSLYIRSDYKDTIINIIAKTDLLEKRQYKYSDLSYFLFKDYIERYYHKNLNELTQSHFYKGIGANRTTYLPLEKFSLNEIVPTEIDNYYRYTLVHGYVHDMGAAMQGGIGGHAGLFSNANDVAKIMQMYLQKGFYGGKRYIQSSTIDAFNTRYYEKEKVRKGVGFDKPQIIEVEKATCGCVSDKSFGHSGFTGTFTWADPETDLIYVFLSNRVYPNAENMGLVRSNARTIIQQYIQDAIIEK